MPREMIQKPGTCSKLVETVFGLSPFVINGINNEEKDSTTM